MAEQRESSLESNRELKNYLSYYSIFLLLVVFVFLVNRNRLLGIAKSNKALSEIDQLTGLMNRRHFLQQLEASLLQKKDIGGAVIFVDLDGFKPINDQLGHNAGDEILKIMSTRLLNIATHHQHEGVGFYVARLGGDEFVILLDCLAKIDIEKVASEVADSIVQTCSAQLPSLYTLYPLSASVGVAFYPTHACEIIELLHCADQAMYQSKRKGKNRYTIHQNNVP